MTHPMRLQFRLLPPEAREAALRRLALSGLDPTAISAQTGMPESEVRRHVFDPYVEHIKPRGRQFRM